MEPTIEVELAIARRTLTTLVNADDCSEEVAAVLTEVVRSLQVLERSWATRLPYLLADNVRLSAFLREDAMAEVLMSLDPGETSETSEPEDAPPSVDLAAVEATNKRLRGLLARSIVAAGQLDGDAAAAVRRNARSVLLESLRERPW